MKREHHRKRDDRDEGGTAEQEKHPGRTVRPGGGNDGEFLANDDDNLQDEDAGDEESGPEAQAASASSHPILKQHIRNAWEAVRENEASIARGIYDRLDDKDAGKSRSAGFFGTLFQGLADVGAAQLIAKITPTTAAASVLIAVYNAAKVGVAQQLPKSSDVRKVVPSEFIEQYIREYINTGWHDGADLLETRMAKLGKKALRALRTHMRTLASKVKIDNPTIQDKMLNAWMRALNQEHQREGSGKDYDTETSGRLHLEGVDIFVPPGEKPTERIGHLNAWLDGTGTIRDRLRKRRLSNVKVPVTVRGDVSEFGSFSFGVGSEDAPKAGPMQAGVDEGLRRYGGIGKLWDKMKTHTVGELVTNFGGSRDD